jgi:DNA-binding FadR family transcriptional regulator
MLEIIRPKKLADQVYESVLKQIMSGEYPEGMRLPSEKDLSGIFDVSRPIVREALSRLRSDGIIVSRHGSGSYVRYWPGKALPLAAPTGANTSVMGTYAFRLALECEAAALAAVHRTAKDLAHISRAHGKLEKAIRNGEPGVEAAVDFHLAITIAAKDHLFHNATELLSPQVSKTIKTARRLSQPRSAERLRRVQREHEQIMTHIHDSDPKAAHDAMRMHLSNAEARVLRAGGER